MKRLMMLLVNNWPIVFVFGVAIPYTIWILCDRFLYENKQTKEQPKCISEQALRGCELAGSAVEEQLRSCEWVFRRCLETNEQLQEKEIK